MINYEQLKTIDIYSAFAITAYQFNELKTIKQQKDFVSRSLNRYLMMEDCFLTPSQKNYDVIAFKTLSPQRSDYKQIFDSICEHLKASLRVKVVKDFENHVPGYINENRASFYKKNIWIKRIFPTAWPHYLKRTCFVQLIHALYIYEKYISNSTRKVTLSFSDMQVLDNIIIQLENQKNVKTCTMQHGLYVDYEEFNTINKVNYICSPSNYFLAWGEDTARLMKRYHPNKTIFICGKPTPSSKHWSTSNTIECMDVSITRKPCLIICDQEIFRRENFKMISIALSVWEKNDIHIRNHPQNNRNEYLQNFDIEDNLLEMDNYDFILGHSSTLLYEAIEDGFHVCQLRSSAKRINLPNNMQFLNSAELRDVCDLQKKHYINLNCKFIAHSGLRSLELTKIFIDHVLQLNND